MSRKVKNVEEAVASIKSSTNNPNIFGHPCDVRKPE